MQLPQGSHLWKSLAEMHANCAVAL